MSSVSPGTRLRSLIRCRGLTALAGLASIAFVPIVASCSKIEVVLVGTPILVPNPATAGTWVRVTVQLVDKAGCGQASMSVNYNGATRPTKLVSTGGTYMDSVFASLAAANVQAIGTCGGAIQSQTAVLTVTP